MCRSKPDFGLYLAPTKAKILLELKKMEEEKSPDAEVPADDVLERHQHSGTLFLSNALEIEDLQYACVARSHFLC